MAISYLNKGKKLIASQGDYLISNNGIYKLTINKRGVLSITHRDIGVIWASNAQYQGGDCRLVFQADGNLVVYKHANEDSDHAIWASKAYNSSNTGICILGDDGNFVAYTINGGEAYWATNTGI